MESRQIVWLFFGLSGRLDRRAYALAGLLLLMVQFFFLYRFMSVPEGTPQSGMWASAFMVATIIALLSNLALAVKRLHDLGKPGVIALLFILAGVLMYVALCVIPGDTGPNRYGARTNAPS